MLTPVSWYDKSPNRIGHTRGLSNQKAPSSMSGSNQQHLIRNLHFLVPISYACEISVRGGTLWQLIRYIAI